MEKGYVKAYSLSDQIWSLLKESIIKGELKSGDRILELEVAKMYNVSQAPVREALLRLKKEGFVIHYPNKGTFVSNISNKDIDEIYSFREAIEPLAIKEAIKNITDEDLVKLKELYQQMLQAGESNDLDELNRVDIIFHTFIYEIANHKYMFKVWESLSSASNRVWYLTSQLYFNKLDEVAKLHKPIIDALHERDAEKCIEAFKTHIRYTWNNIKNEGDFN